MDEQLDDKIVDAREAFKEARKQAFLMEQENPGVPTPNYSQQARRAFYAAKALAQGAFQPIVKNRMVKMRLKESQGGGVIEFRYADWEEIKSKTRDALSANGFSTTAFLEQKDEKSPVWLHAVLSHADGYEERSSVMLLGAENPKQFAAEVSYFKRYLLSNLLDVAADDDLDENGQVADDHATPPAPPAPKPAPARRSERQASAPKPPSAPSGPPDDDIPPPEEFTSPQPVDMSPHSKRGESLSEGQRQPTHQSTDKPSANQEESGELASGGEVEYICKRTHSRGASMRDVLDNLGLKHLPDTAAALKGKLLKSDWERIKAKV